MFALIKANALYCVYGIGVVLFFLALSGNIRLPLLFLVSLMPLRNVVDRLHTMPLGKDFVDLLFLAILIGSFISSVGQGRKTSESNPLAGITITMIVYMLFSTLMGSAYLNAPVAFDITDPRIQDWKNFCMLPVLYFLTLRAVKDRKWVWYTVVLMCAVMFVMDFYLMQQMTWYSSLESRKKIAATFVYLGPNEVAAFYNQYTIILLSLWFVMKKSWAKLALTVLIGLNIFCILFLFSRAAYMGLTLGLLILFLFRQKMLIIPLLLVVILWKVVLPPKVVERIEVTLNPFGELDESSAFRILIWKHSLDLFGKNPVFGVGFGVFRYMGFELGDTHNIYLKILAEQGLVGIIIFLLLIVILFMLGTRLYAKGKDDLSKSLGLGFAIAMLVLLVNNAFGDRWTYMEVSSNLWVFAALVTRLIHLSDAEEDQPPETQKKKGVSLKGTYGKSSR